MPKSLLDALEQERKKKEEELDKAAGEQYHPLTGLTNKRSGKPVAEGDIEGRDDLWGMTEGSLRR